MMIRLSSMKLVLLIRMIYGGLTGEDIKAAVENVLRSRNLEYTIINPLFGYMFRANGCVENMRFYSPELKIKYANDVRDHSLDSSEEPFTRLLVHLFPSDGGTLNTLIRLKENFRNRYFIENKPYWSKSYDISKGSQENRIENIKMFRRDMCQSFEE